MIKKQTILLTVIYNDEETYANDASDAISNLISNEDGFLEWDYKVLDESSLKCDILEDIKKHFKK